MMTVVSKSQYAALRNVALQTVSTWIAREQLTEPALLSDGNIDVAAADLQLRERIDPTRSIAHAPNGLFGPRDADGDTPPPPAADDPVRRRQVALADQAEVEANEKRLAFEARRGKYLLAEDVAALRGRAYADLMRSVDRWLPSVVAEIGGGQTELVIARHSWRAFRTAEADAAMTRAGELPELVGDE